MNEEDFKVIVVGNTNAGKTSIIRRYVHNSFSTTYRATIGVDFALKIIKWDENTEYRLQLWDIAGQDRFGSMTRSFYVGTAAAVIVFDITSSSSFEAARKWKSDIDTKVVDDPFPVILLANKVDLVDEIAFTHDQIDKFCKEMGCAGWFETSARDGQGINNAFQFLTQLISENHHKRSQPILSPNKLETDTATIKLESNQPPPPAPSYWSYCCQS